MILLTKEIKKALPDLYTTEKTPLDEKKIIVRFFNPMGNQSWEVAEGCEEDGDWIFFAKCDLGFGSAEWGYVTLSELESVSCGLGLGIERDICSGETHYHPEWASM
tara:strand:+ start:295 stop:612 length:318 start_codon:yes stop_codon:yes gene_type:complete